MWCKECYECVYTCTLLAPTCSALAAFSVYCSINVSNYRHPATSIHLLTHTGCHHSAHMFSRAKIPACAGFLRVKPHLHSAAQGFLTWEIPTNIAGELDKSWARVPMDSDLCHEFASSWQNRTSVCLLLCLVVCVSLWVLVWLCFVETAVSLKQCAAMEKKHRKTLRI